MTQQCPTSSQPLAIHQYLGPRATSAVTAPVGCRRARFLFPDGVGRRAADCRSVAGLRRVSDLRQTAMTPAVTPRARSAHRGARGDRSAAAARRQRGRAFRSRPARYKVTAPGRPSSEGHGAARRGLPTGSLRPAGLTRARTWCVIGHSLARTPP